MAMLECALAVLWPLLTASLNQDGITVCSQFLQYLQGVNNTPPQMKDPASMSFLAKVSKMVNRVQHVLGEATS
ncbi:hypothetical protein HaLaN_04232 [Haematococcus lacustris]|uniref:Uncharacterized protein n=1 Tax=Haematococcus lacustris TaxID=44745 RepID=A0A699YG34_HAELA|nr:hypothetical protein HaLaN_04232 [Haematococcus lacustris]